jgi:hypothetical protein
VNSEHAAWITAVIVLLTVGLLISRQFLDVPNGAHVARRSDPVNGAGPEANGTSAAEGSFRQWFWESRGLDLVAQVGLIFAGALGIAALLPQGADDRHPGEEEI